MQKKKIGWYSIKTEKDEKNENRTVDHPVPACLFNGFRGPFEPRFEIKSRIKSIECNLFAWRNMMPYEPHRGGIFVTKPFRKSYEPCKGGIFTAGISLTKHAVPTGLDHHHGRFYYKYAAPMGLNRISTQIGYTQMNKSRNNAKKCLFGNSRNQKKREQI